jgi:hypothetical protein
VPPRRGGTPSQVISRRIDLGRVAELCRGYASCQRVPVMRS